ncbi:hypothetical protein [Guggenheimella bovis]
MRDLLILLRFQFIMSLNTRLYMLRTIPGMKRILPDALFGAKRAKGAVYTLLFILNIIFSFAIATALYFLVHGISVSLSKFFETDFTSAFVGTFWLMIVMFPGLVSPEMVDVDVNHVTLVRMLGFPAKTNVLGRIFLKLLKIVPYVPVIYLFAPENLKVVFLSLLVLRVGLVLFAEIFWYGAYHFSEGLFKTRGYLPLIMTAPFGIILGLGLGLGFDFTIFSKPAVTIGALIVSLLSGVILLKANDYKKLLKKVLSIESALKYNPEELKKAQITANTVGEQNISKEAIQVDESKKGYEYIHEIFHKRYKKAFMKPIRFRVIAYTIFFIVLIAGNIFIEEPIGPVYRDVFSKGAFYFLYLFHSMGKKFVSIYFANMDVTLLHYSYYRQPEMVLTGLKTRLKESLRLSALPTLVLILGFGIHLALFLRPFQWTYVLFMALEIIILTVFYTLHEFIIYYAIQPYNENMETKSIFSIITSMGIAIGSYLLLMLQDIPLGVVIGIIVFMVIYSIVGVQVMLRRAPKHFKLK